MIERVRAEGKHRSLHASPSLDNGPSNAVCRKAGLTLQGEVDVEYARGHIMRGNDWRLDLRAEDHARGLARSPGAECAD